MLIRLENLHSNIINKPPLLRGNQMNIKNKVLLVGVIAVFLAAEASHAQDAAVNPRRSLEEVVVTAQKRAESMQDIPVAVSALSEDKLQQSGFDGVEDLSFMVPSMQFGNFGPVTFLNMRGIGSADNFAGSDPGVAMHIDGVYIGRPVGALFTAFDMERVEVLRGPQGTLYGRNATGGSVNLITKKPQDEFGGEAEVTLGDYSLIRTRGSLNLPLNDNVRARIVAFKEDRDGFTTNTHPGGTEANDLDNWGIRSHLDVDLSDNVNLLLSATHIDIGGVGNHPEQRDTFSTGELNPQINPLAGDPMSPFFPGIPANLAVFTNDDGSIPVNDQRPFIEGIDHSRLTDNQLTMLSATLQWDFESFTLKSITGYAESEYFIEQDADASTAANTNISQEEQSDQFSQEIQFISNGDGPLTWIGGLYYFKEDASRYSRVTGGRFEAIRNLFVANNFSFGGPGFNEDFVFSVGGDIETESFAVFGQSSYDLMDDLSLTLGLRYTDDEKNAVNRNIQLAPLVLTPVTSSSEEVTGKVSLDYQIASDAMLYASFSRGYKSGGVVQVATDPVAASFKPEFVDTIEIGVKSQLWDVLQLNAAVYTSDYTDLQTGAEGAFGPLGGNAASASIEGFELEWTWLISDTLTFDGSFAYTDATYDVLQAFNPLDQAFIGGVVDYSGNSLPRAPEIAYNLGITNFWDLDDYGTLMARLEGSYTDEMFYEFTNIPETKTDEYYNLNFRLTWVSIDEKYTAEFYATNLTDEIQEGNLLLGFSLDVSTQPNGFAEPGQEYITYNAPRQLGVKFGYKF